ncbi:MAG: GAF domain-containing protein [Chloroflexi bacterium]|nr:GAF domain-containing protein [Chloroflexota bacterium]
MNSDATMIFRRKAAAAAKARQRLPRRERNLHKILGSVYAGNCCRVLGPRYHNKTRLMRQAVERLNQDGDHVAIYLKLGDIRRDDETQFFTHLHDTIREKLPPALSAEELAVCETAVAFQYALVEWSRQSDRNLTLFLDSLEMAPPNLVASLLGALRAAFTMVVNQPGAHFQAVVCGSLSLSQVALDNASRFESISDLVLVTELDEQERLEQAILLCREANLVPMTSGLHALLAQTGGDPFLISQMITICAKQMKQAGWTRMTDKRVAEAAAAFLQDETHWAVIESLRQIEINPSLLSCALLLLERGEAPDGELPVDSGESPTALDLCGAFGRTAVGYKLKSLLWVTMVRRHLTPARVGGLYAIAGDWARAMHYLGLAVRAGETAVKPELFAATINAIHASEETLQAFVDLGRGLQAAYPESDTYLYYQTDDALRLVYPVREAAPDRRAILLEKTNRPEIEALRGPEYSILPINGENRLLFPLRIGPIGAHTVGLASFSRLTSSDSPYEQREERMQLSAFLRQAARALEAKGQFVHLLDTTTRHADKLKTFNKILTRILHHRDQPETVLLRSVLEGITHGWGLEFNRAMLFVPDEKQRQLVGSLSIGHPTRAETEAEWEAEPFDRETVDEWLAGLFTTQEEKARRQQRLQALVETIEVPITAVDDPLIQCYRRQLPILSSQHNTLAGFTRPFYDIVQPPIDFALAPLQAGEQVSGVIYVDNKFTGRPIAAESYELLQTFVSQAALIIENARAFAAEKQRSDALTHLLRVEDAVNNQITQSVRAVLAEIVASAQELFGAECVVVYPLRSTDLGTGLLNYDRDHITHVGVRDEASISQPRPSGGMATWVIQEGVWPVLDTATAVVPTNGTAVLDSEFIRQEGIRSFAGVRLGNAENPVGVLYLNWREPHRFSYETLRLIRIFANFAAVAIPSARRYQQVRADLDRRNQELTSLGRVLKASLEIHSEEGIEEAIRWALETAQEQTGAPHPYLIRNEPNDRWRVFYLAASGRLEAADKELLPGKMPFTTFSQAAGRLVNLCADEVIRDPSLVYQPDTCCLLEMPVMVTSNCLAVLRLESPLPDSLTEAHQEYLQHVVSRLAVTMEQIERTQALRRLLEISWQLTHERELPGLLHFLVQQAMLAMRTVSAITLYHVDMMGQLVLGEMAGVKRETAVTQQPPYTPTVINQIWQLTKPLFAENVRQNSLLSGPFVHREGIRSTAVFPLQVKEERVGCMFFNYRLPHVFDDSERSLLSLFAHLTAMAIHQARLNAELQHARDRELWQRISQLSTGMIHDINSAVASIPDLTAEIETKLRSAKDVSAPLADLRRNAEKTGQLSARLRDLVIHQQFRPEVVPLRSLIQTAVAELQEQKPPHIDIHFQDNNQTPEIWADRLLIVRLLHNLIVNAWDAIPPQRQGRVEINLTVQHREAQIDIRDNGAGIEPDNVPRVFEPDFTTKENQSGIHGIGLYYCRQIAREHRGELEVASVVGVGTTFTIVLPCFYDPLGEE